MGDSSSSSVLAGIMVSLLVYGLVALAIFLIIRSLVLWYWRINTIVDEQRKQTELLRRIQHQFDWLVNTQYGANQAQPAKVEAPEAPADLTLVAAGYECPYCHGPIQAGTTTCPHCSRKLARAGG